MHKHLALSFLALLLSACGGGGGGGGGGGAGAGPDAFLGEYGYVSFEGVEASAYGNPRTIAISEWGRWQADGLGAWTYTDATVNAEGSVQNVILSGGPGSYTLDAAHGLERTASRPGSLRADGAVGSAIRLTRPTVELFTHPGGQIVPADYALMMFQYDGTNDAAVWATLTLTPGGTATNMLLSFNQNGSRGDDLPVPTGSYTSLADGTIDIALGTVELRGTVGPNSQFALLAGSPVDGTNLQAVAVLVRLQTGATDASFSGEFCGVSIEGPASAGGAPAWTVRRRTILADGTGMFQIRDGEGTLDGRYLAPASIFSTPRAYTMAPNGVFQTPVQTGVVTPDGRTLVMAGGLAPGSRPSFAFYTR